MISDFLSMWDWNDFEESEDDVNQSKTTDFILLWRKTWLQYKRYVIFRKFVFFTLTIIYMPIFPISFSFIYSSTKVIFNIRKISTLDLMLFPNWTAQSWQLNNDEGHEAKSIKTLQYTDKSRTIGLFGWFRNEKRYMFYRLVSWLN